MADNVISFRCQRPSFTQFCKDISPKAFLTSTQLPYLVCKDARVLPTTIKYYPDLSRPVLYKVKICAMIRRLAVA